MKILSREFWGTILIFVGLMVFLFVLYDSIRPFFPLSAQDPLAKKITGFFSSLFNRSGASPDASPPPPAPPAPPAPGASPPGLLTGGVYQAKGDYCLWVWGVKPEKKAGDKVTVEIAHPVAGEKGAFQVVAAADTNGDGKPDREIARSKILSAEQPRAYSSFTFTTPEKAIFVGNAWPERDGVSIYRGNGPWPIADSPFQDHFYLEIGPGDNQPAGPAFTNMKISFSD